MSRGGRKGCETIRILHVVPRVGREKGGKRDNKGGRKELKGSGGRGKERGTSQR